MVQTGASGTQNVESGQQNKSLDEYKKIVLNYCRVPKTAREISEYLGLKSRQYISTKIIKSLIGEGKLEYANKKVLMLKIKNILLLAIEIKNIFKYIKLE